jgi:hypothetical protein
MANKHENMQQYTSILDYTGQWNKSDKTYGENVGISTHSADSSATYSYIKKKMVKFNTIKNVLLSMTQHLHFSMVLKNQQHQPHLKTGWTPESEKNKTSETESSNLF